MGDNDNDNVVILDMETSLDLPLERILDGARDHELSDCLVLGYEPDSRFYMACTTVEIGKILILLERCRQVLVNRL
jgi:hypothetical protein